MSVPSIKMMVRLVHPRNYHDEKRLDTVLPPSPHTHAVSAIPSYLQTVGLILLYYLGKVTKNSVQPDPIVLLRSPYAHCHIDISTQRILASL